MQAGSPRPVIVVVCSCRWAVRSWEWSRYGRFRRKLQRHEGGRRLAAAQSSARSPACSRLVRRAIHAVAGQSRGLRPHVLLWLRRARTKDDRRLAREIIDHASISDLIEGVKHAGINALSSSSLTTALKIARWWHFQHNTSSDRAPLARMLPRVIGSPAWDRGRVSMPVRIPWPLSPKAVADADLRI
jgi:hypothetical protein